MERLTYDFCVGDKHCWQVKGAYNLECREVCRNQGEKGCTDCPIAKAFDRLAAYEETGLEPEDMKKAFNEDATLKLAGQILGVTPGRLRELAQADKADEIGKYRFYYCESKDEYLIGARLDTFYYARWDGSSFTWSMSRYLPWGKHVVAPETAWKEYTYPSEPKEIGMSEWFKGFLGKLTREAAEAALKEREAEHE
ncbi:hypothetical protein [Ruthenibacterium lactatiformans]|uniref:hypothetical protein n=1 Tax=Ruthenibacterium lactatiformans TaxID=1550024 RepID=UPI002674E734|nr:hypothetical protein [Ruthenibacterium lactatiformans]